MGSSASRSRKPTPDRRLLCRSAGLRESVAKLALGVSDNQALTQVNEAIGLGSVPVVVFPRVNAAHARHPAWDAHIAALRRAGVRLVYGNEVGRYTSHAPHPGRELPLGGDPVRDTSGRALRVLALT